MQPDRGADEFGRDDIALKELPEREDSRDNADADPIAPELEQRQTDRQHPADDRTNVWDEGHRPCDCADHEAEIQPRHHQRHRIERAENHTDGDLPAHEAREHTVDLAREAAHRLAVIERQPAIDFLHHPVPVVEHVERHDRNDDDEDEEVQHPHRRGENARQQLAAARLDRLAELGERVVENGPLAHQRGELNRDKPL